MQLIRKSGIEWTDFALNVYIGCAYACRYCYASYILCKRFKIVNDWSNIRPNPIGKLNYVKGTKYSYYFAEWESLRRFLEENNVKYYVKKELARIVGDIGYKPPWLQL